MTVHNPGRRGICPVCGLEVGLLDDGTVRNHYRRADDGRKIGADRAWCPGTRKEPVPVERLVPVDEDGLLLGLVEVFDGIYSSADAALCAQNALTIRAWLLEHYELREPAS